MTSRARDLSVTSRAWHLLPALLLGLCVFSWYLVTLAPSLVWADGGRLQTDAVTGESLYWHFKELAGVETDGWPFDRLGIAAWDHPVWVMLGHGLTLTHLADPARVLNLLSAVPATLASVGLFVIVRRLSGDAWGAAAGAIALAVSHVYWFHAVTAEVYALHALFMVLLIAMALRWDRLTRGWLALLAVVAGLGLANHIMLAITVLPVVIFLVVRHRSCPPAERPRLGWPGAAAAAALFALGWAPWWVQFLRMAGVAGFGTTVGFAAGFPWLGHRWPGPIGVQLLANAGEYLGILLYQFTPVGVAVGGYGAIRMWRRQRPEAVLLLALFGLHAIFSANYQVADRFAFHLPSYGIFAIFVGYGVTGVVARWRRAGVVRQRVAGALAVAVMAAPIGLYAVVPGLLHSRGITAADLGIPSIGRRDGLEYFLNPNQRGDDSAAQYGRQALDTMAADALVLLAWPDDLEPYVTMRYFQLTERRRTDIDLDLMLFTGLPVRDSVLAVTASQRGCRPIYLASVDPDTYPIEELRREFTIVPEGPLVRLVPLRETVSTCLAPEPVSVTLDDLVRSVRR